MTFFAGFDGGQSGTTAVVGDAAGRVLGRGRGPRADLARPGDPAACLEAQREALDAALDAAFAAATLPAETRVDRAVAGISGFEPGLSPAPTLARVAGLAVVHDAEIAHAGALGGGPGIVAIAGTGSVVLGRARSYGPFVRAGGWGATLGDGGSAVDLARRALGRAAREWDRGRRSAVAARALAFYAVPSLRELQQRLGDGRLGTAELAAFAASVLELGAAGDADAAKDVAEAVAGLAGDVALVAERLPPAPPVSYAGGLFVSGVYREAFARACRAAVPGADVRPPRSDAAVGALGLAVRA